MSREQPPHPSDKPKLTESNVSQGKHMNLGFGLGQDFTLCCDVKSNLKYFFYPKSKYTHHNNPFSTVLSDAGPLGLI